VSEPFRHLLPWAALAIAAGAAVACPSRRQGPDTPDLDQQSRETARRLQRTRSIREVMMRDLEKFRSLADELREPPLDLFTDPFPLDLFKHVVVECLNAPATSEDEAEPDEPDAGRRAVREPDAERTPESPALNCDTRFVDELDARLREHAPDMRRRASELLRKIDSFREFRIRLRRRIAKIDAILADNRELLAARRADLRKLRARWRQRKPELSTRRWRQLQNRFDTLERDLEDLEGETDRLTSAADQWPDAIDRADRRVYFAITSRWTRGE